MQALIIKSISASIVSDNTGTIVGYNYTIKLSVLAVTSELPGPRLWEIF